MKAYLEFEHISKSFPGVRALDDVSLSVAEGSVHGLVGENGAGKSTLLKILAGAYVPESGSIQIAGTAHVFRSASEALDAGIAVIYQELQLVPEMTVAENLFLGHFPTRFGVLNRKDLLNQARAQLEFMGEDVDPSKKVGDLSIAQAQMVEIAKALTRGAKILAFDEPTSSLMAREAQKLFSIIQGLRRQGCAILYVSHRLDEIFRLCDRVTVFRDGRHIETFESVSGLTQDALVSRMVGRDLSDIYGYSVRPQGPARLEVEHLEGPGLTGPASFSVARGEILGLFGLVGAGRTELLRLLYGASRPRAGLIRLDGQALSIREPLDAIRSGILFCPEDRKKEGIIAIRSVMENLNISARRTSLRLGCLIHRAWEKDNASTMVARLGIKTPSLDQVAGNLSGGNQQKVILARWLSQQVKVMLLDEPTRGIDVGAKREIYDIIFDLARQGVCVIMASGDLPEVLGVADRVLVLREGQIAASVGRAEASEETLLRWALPKGTGSEEKSYVTA